MTQAYIHGIDHSGSSTNWSAYNLEQIWEMVKTETGRVTFTQIDAWGRMARLCTDQADQLERATGQLLQRWPARPGSASEAFSARVTSLVTSMRQAAAASAANPDPLSKISAALAKAQGEVAALFETRRHYASIEQQLTPQPTPSPGQIPSPAAPAGLQPPPQNWREQLNQQARTIMSQADATVGAEAARIEQPNLYTFKGMWETTTPLATGDEPVAGGSAGGGNASQRGLSSVNHAESFGPDLRPPSGSSSVDLANVGGLGSAAADPILSGGPAAASGGALPGDPNGLSGPQSGMQGPGSAVSGPAYQGLVPGPMIGGRVAQPSYRVPASNELPGTEPRTTMAGRAGATAGMPMAPMIPPRGGRGSESASRLSTAGRIGRGGRNRRAGGNPDDPWAVAEGGPAVLEPPPEPTEHDPGPGVIGYGR